MQARNVEEDVDLSHRTVLVTGGGSGLGRELAVEIAGAGASVHICGRRREPLDTLAAGHDNITAHQLDVTDEGASETMFDAIGPVEIVIANAGIAGSAPLHRTTSEMWHQMMAVNLTGCFLTFRAGLQRLRAAKAEWGRLIAISSTTGLSGHKYASAYSASKHGVNGLVRSAAAELAGSGITATSILLSWKPPAPAGAAAALSAGSQPRPPRAAPGSPSPKAPCWPMRVDPSADAPHV